MKKGKLSSGIQKYNYTILAPIYKKWFGKDVKIRYCCKINFSIKIMTTVTKRLHYEELWLYIVPITKKKCIHISISWNCKLNMTICICLPKNFHKILQTD